MPKLIQKKSKLISETQKLISKSQKLISKVPKLISKRPKLISAGFHLSGLDWISHTKKAWTSMCRSGYFLLVLVKVSNGSLAVNHNTFTGTKWASVTNSALVTNVTVGVLFRTDLESRFTERLFTEITESSCLIKTRASFADSSWPRSIVTSFLGILDFVEVTWTEAAAAAAAARNDSGATGASFRLRTNLVCFEN